MATASATAPTAAVLLASALLLSWLMLRRKKAATPATTPVSTSTTVPRASTAAEIAAAVRAEGVCVVENVLDAATLADLQARLAAIKPRKMQNRRAHRWEHVHSPEAPPLAELGSLPIVASAVRALLGPKNYLEKAGMLVSHPGADPQRWHMDTPLLFSVGAHLPPHSLSVFVPLVDLVPSNGPTEFQLATHVKANLVKPQRHATACCPAGSIVIYVRHPLLSPRPVGPHCSSLCSSLLQPDNPEIAPLLRRMYVSCTVEDLTAVLRSGR